MMPLLRTRTLLLAATVTIAATLQSSTVLGMTIPFRNNYGNTNTQQTTSENMQDHGGNGHQHQWQETASGIPTTGEDWIMALINI